MCKTEESMLEDLPPPPKAAVHSPPVPALRASSTISSSSSDTSSDSDESPSLILQHYGSRDSGVARRKQLDLLDLEPTSTSSIASGDLLEEEEKVFPVSKEETSSWSSLAVSITTGFLNAAFWVAFSLYFPFMLAPYAATATYDTAYYEYHPETSHFDNTAWTYGTDYGLAVIMAVLVASIMRYSKTGVTDALCRRSASLLSLYGLSVTAGGIAHHSFTTLESRNTTVFRLLWTTCVGTVCLASCSMGMIASEAIRKFQQHYKNEQQLQQQTALPCKQSTSEYLLMKVPLISDAFWMAFGVTVAVACAVGGLSFQRPACDIFIAGITQTLSTGYCMIFFFLVQHKRVANWAKMMGFVGFILNAPLLPMYPLLVQYTDWSLASVNTLLHSWLCVAWSMQGISMRHVIRALVMDSAEAPKKVQ